MLVVVAACTGSSGDTTTTVTFPPTEVTPIATDRLLDELELESLIGVTAELRGLEFSTPVQVVILDDEEFRVRVNQLLAAPLDLDPDPADSWLRLLGVMPEGSNVYSATSRLEQYGVAINDPGAGRILVRAGAGIDPFVESAVVGELVRLLHTQNFGSPDPVLVTGERGYVYRAITEGDVLRIRQLFIGDLDSDDEFRYELGLQASSEDTTAVRASTPPYVLNRLRQPADTGVRYLQGLSESEVDDLLRLVTDLSPAVPSSEAMIVTGADLEVRSVDLPPVAVVPYQRLPLDATLGVGQLRLLLDGAIPADLLEEALVGWGGDELDVRIDGTDVIFAYAFRGETPEDTQEMAAAFRILLDQQLAEGAYGSVRVADDTMLVLAASDPSVQDRLDEVYADFGEEVFLVQLG